MKTLFALVSMDEVVCKQTEMMRRLLIIKQISGWGVWCVRACVRACVCACVCGGGSSWCFIKSTELGFVSGLLTFVQHQHIRPKKKKKKKGQAESVVEFKRPVNCITSPQTDRQTG